ncbi:selenocysteine lyase/cysteine desulfurase [Propionicimonas paludicola]|uniref:Selenocysteine lyase/cysteine desulfurase n=1 Tax=Propionicimonas paludicola TaxID=185243 RepID=A0A2A9CS84_9ACTN|nr:aminotransferase class V-fold PLP-dependent enzyme [Propionicimonas paludicola]PFG17307.1 selenocysteine lyase/cysteine desulfurase [Propionicimonas paludicola]
MVPVLTADRLTVAELAAHFHPVPGYLAAASSGVAADLTLAALRADQEAWSQGRRGPADYDQVVSRTRRLYAELVGVPDSWVAIGSTTSALVANLAAGLPAGAEVLVPEEEFTSIVYPFLASGQLQVRSAPLNQLAAAIGPQTAVVAFSVVQSATGELADLAAIREAAGRVGALTLADLTQAAGLLPVAATGFDLTVCHAYKWLCAPRGVAFLTVRPDLIERLTPVSAGWYAGDDPWASCYGTDFAPARTARRFDTSPAWQAFAGAEAALSLFVRADLEEVWRHCSGLGDRLCRGLGLEPRHQAIVSWPDPEGCQLAALTAAGIQASGRAGRVRVAFAVWNTTADVDAVLAAVGRPADIAR